MTAEVIGFYTDNHRSLLLPSIIPSPSLSEHVYNPFSRILLPEQVKKIWLHTQPQQIKQGWLDVVPKN